MFGTATLADLFFAQLRLAEEERDRVYEPVVGVVTNNNDPDKLGRVQVKFPSLSMDDCSAWAPVVSPGAGKGRGWFFLPEVDDEVLCMFEHGDITRPLVVGAMWNGKDAPPKPNGGGKSSVCGIVSRSGSTILFDDEAGTVTIADSGGAGTITIDKQNKITLEAKQGDVVIACKDDLTIVAKEVEMTATTQLEISSATSDVKCGSDANVALKGAAMVQITGASTALNGGSAQAPPMPTANPQEVPTVVGSGAGGGGSSNSGTSSGGGGGSAGGAGGGGGAAQAEADAPAGNPIPSDPPPVDDPPKDAVMVTIVDQSGQPLSGVAYELKDANGEVHTGSSNPEGVIEVRDLPKGDCTLTLPDLDENDWSIG